MNLNKYTKAELISKFKRLDNKNSNQTLIYKVLGTIIKFKSLILKITLIAFLIKWFKKYSLVRKIWQVFSTIGSTFLGISLVDIYGFDLLSYLKDTQIYNWFSDLVITPKSEIPHEDFSSKNPINMVERITTETNGNQKSSEISSKINGWFNKQEIIEETKPIEDIKPEESNNKKYYIIAALLLLSCLAWYYYGDDIKPLPGIALEKIKSFRRKPESTDGNNVTTYDNHDLSNSSWKDSLQNISNKIKSKFRKDDDKTFHENIWGYWDDFENKFKFSKDLKKEKLKTEVKNKFIDNPQAEASSSKVKLEDLNREDYNEYFDKGSIKQEKLEVFQPITGNNFNKEADSVLKEVSQFLDYSENSKFPKTEIQEGLYRNITDRLVKLNEKYPDEYNNKILNHEGYNNLVESFFNTKDLQTLDVKPLSPIAESDTYNEIALATVHEQEVWSDKAASIYSQQVNSPSNHSQSVHSPSVKSPSVHSPVIEEQNQSFLGEFLQRQGEFQNQIDINQQINEEINKGKPSIDTRSSLLDQIKARRNDSYVIDDFNKELPEIDVSSASNSNSSIENVLPEQVSKPKFNALFDQIKSRRNDSHVVESPNVSNVGLTPILDKVKGLFTPKSENKTLDILDKGKSIDNKPSFSNLLEDTNALFDDDLDIPINQEPTNLIENLSSPVISWDSIKFNLLDNKSFEINFEQIWRITKAIHLATNDGHKISYSYQDLNLNSLDNKIVKFDIIDKIPKVLDDFPNVKIKEVIIEDLNGNFNSIYKI